MNRHNRIAEKRRESFNRKTTIIFLLAVLFMTIAATVVEAAAMDSVKNWWGKTKVFVMSPAFWVNAIVVFAVIMVLYMLLLSESVGTDTTKQAMMYIIIGLIAIIIATKIVDSGVPVYIWKNTQFTNMTRFLLGEKDANGVYNDTKGNSRQAILRINNNGAGLPAFLIASILFYLLFLAKKESLGLDKVGDKAGQWIPIILSLLLGGLIANGGITKNQIIILGGWAAVILLGGTLGKSLSGEEKEEGGGKKWLGYGLAYALVQIIANMLGTSLWGGEASATGITAGSVLMNIAIGLGIGFIWNAISGGGGGVFNEWKKRMSGKRQEDVDKLIDDEKYGQAFGRSIPFFGRLFGSGGKGKAAKDSNRKIERLEKEREQLNNAYLEIVKSGRRADPSVLGNLTLRMNAIEQEIEAEMHRMEGETEPATSLDVPPDEPIPPPATATPPSARPVAPPLP